MNSFKIIKKFEIYFNEDKCTEGLATVKCLRDLISSCCVGTITEYGSLLNSAVAELSESDFSIAPIKSASELFMRYITFCKLDNNFDDSKTNLLKKADLFINKISKSIDVISNLCQNILKNATNILVLGGSKTVWETLIQYIKRNHRKEINLYVLGSPIENYLLKLSKLSNSISFVEIDFQNVTHYLNVIDLGLFGAEAVVGNGGIVNELGTLNIAILAESFRIPFYVLTESIRFTRFYPLSQNDIPLEFKYKTSIRNENKNLNTVVPRVDYTPPEYITMIITDIGYIPPANVSEELFKLYL